MNTAEGWAVIGSDGSIRVRTVSPTRQGAIVNWLLVDMNLTTTTIVTDVVIEHQWQLDSKDQGARVARVLIAERQ